MRERDERREEKNGGVGRIWEKYVRRRKKRSVCSLAYRPPTGIRRRGRGGVDDGQ